jgi:hypothetical protein
VDEGRRLARSSWETFERVRDRQGRLGAGHALLFAALVAGDCETAEMVNATISEEAANLPSAGELWADFLMMQARWHQAQGSLAVAWNHMGRATRALGSHPTPPMRLKSSLLRTQLMWDRQQLKEARPLLDSIISSARQHGLVRTLCEAQAIRFATQCSLGQKPQALDDFSQLLADDVLLNVSVHYFLWRGEAAQGQLQAADTHWETARNLAARCGFAHWDERLGEAATQS